MFTKTIEDTCRSILQAMPTIFTGKKLQHDWDDLLLPHLPYSYIAVIDDAHTAHAAGDSIHRALASRVQCSHLTLPPHSKANDDNLSLVMQHNQKAEALVAVGSGSVNDLVKCAAAKRNIPYVLCPTAASMNGYVSANASISVAGHKQSIPCAMPKAVIADMDIIRHAPKRLTQAGLGDALARSTAQADWLLSHHLIGTEYDDIFYTLMRSYEDAVFDAPEALLAEDAEIITQLFALCLLSGLSMTHAQSSQPASGGEHMIAHAIEMHMRQQQSTHATLPALHGEEMAITTRYATGAWEVLMLQPSPRIAPLIFSAEECKTYFGETARQAIEKEWKKKEAALAARFPDDAIPRELWGSICSAVSAVLIPSNRLHHIIHRAKLPSHPMAVGWGENTLSTIAPYTRFTRNRISFLDLQ